MASVIKFDSGYPEDLANFKPASYGDPGNIEEVPDPMPYTPDFEERTRQSLWQQQLIQLKDIPTNDWYANAGKVLRVPLDGKPYKGKYSVQFSDFMGTAEDVEFIQNGEAAVTRNVGDKLKEIVSVKDFGAVGDGITDDTEAILKALQYSKSSGNRPFVPAGLYMIRAQAIAITATADDQIIGLTGEGEGSKIKIFDGQINNRYRRMFYFEHLDFEGIVIHFDNLLVDHNARGSTPPSDSFEYSQSHTFQCHGGGTGSYKKVLFEDVIIRDPAADGFQNNSARCKSYSVINCEVRDRTRTRSDIQFSRLPERVEIHQFEGTRIESERVEPSPVKIVWHLSNIKVQDLDFGIQAQPSGSVVHITNANIERWANLNGVIFKINNSVIRVGTQLNGRLINMKLGTMISNTDLYLNYNEETNVVRGIDADGSSAIFDNVRFLIDSEDPSIVPTGVLLDDLSTTATGQESSREKIVRNCWFDSRAASSVRPYRNGTWKLINNDYSGHVAAILSVGVNSGYGLSCIVDGGEFTRVSGVGINMHASAGAATPPIVLRGEQFGEAALKISMASGSISSANIVNSRTVIVPSDYTFAGAFKGDIVKIENPVAGLPVSWVCSVASVSSATFLMHSQAGIIRSSSANRPALVDRDRGTQYLDTTLATAGKPIIWTGSVWVDYTGVSV